MKKTDPQEELGRQINEVMRRVATCEIRIDWRSQERRPGAGGRKSRYRGAGDDYDGSRPYTPGDDTRKIDWKAFAVTGGNELSIKTFKMTTEITAYVVIDVSTSMDFGTARTTKRQLAAELAASVIGSLDETQDRAGVVVYSEGRMELCHTPRGAKAVIYPAVAAALGTQPSTDGPGSGLAQALSRLPRHRSLVYVISDFMTNTAADWEALLRASNQHDVLCMFVQDQRERELPKFDYGKGPIGWLLNNIGGFCELQDGSEQRRTIWISNRTRKRYAENFKLHESGILAHFQAAHCRWVIASTEQGDKAGPRILRAVAGGGSR